jgi:hypothetical protein
MSRLVRIRAVEPVRDFLVRLSFTDGSTKEVDLEPLLHGPIFEPMRRDRNEFLRVYVDPESETIAWPNGADMDPDVLFRGLRPAWMDEEAQVTSSPPALGLPGAIDVPASDSSSNAT